MLSHFLETLAPPTHASSISADYLREIYQAADKSKRDCSEGKTKHLVAFDMAVMRACVCMQCAAKASSMESARQSDGTRRNNSQIECFSMQIIRCSGVNVEENVYMQPAEYQAKTFTQKNVFHMVFNLVGQKMSENCSEQRRLLISDHKLLAAERALPRLQKMVGGAAPDARPPVG